MTSDSRSNASSLPSNLNLTLPRSTWSKSRVPTESSGGKVRRRDSADVFLNPSGQGERLKWEWMYLASYQLAARLVLQAVP